MLIHGPTGGCTAVDRSTTRAGGHARPRDPGLGWLRRLGLGIPAGADPADELSLLMAHCRRVAPWNAQVETTPAQLVAPVRIPTDTRAVTAARRALAQAFGRPARLIGSGGCIRLVGTLREIWPPRADLVVWGRKTSPRPGGLSSAFRGTTNGYVIQY
jgi:hypothetical protein